jgi:hypothetical protein
VKKVAFCRPGLVSSSAPSIGSSGMLTRTEISVLRDIEWLGNSHHLGPVSGACRLSNPASLAVVSRRLLPQTNDIRQPPIIGLAIGVSRVLTSARHAT